MQVIELDSVDDPRLAPYRNLRRGRDESDGLFVAEGLWLAERLLASDYEVESVLVERRRRDHLLPRLRTDTIMYVIPDKSVPELVGFDFHRGVLACGRRPQERSVDELPWGTGRSLAVLACRLSDAENLGLVFRNCAAFGAHGVVLGPGCADPLSRRVLRVSMGNVFAIPFAVAPSLEEAVDNLREAGFDVAATVLETDAEPLPASRPADRQALVLGAEADGVTPDVRRRCSRLLTIPMCQGTDSLNVAVASGVFLYWARHGANH